MIKFFLDGFWNGDTVRVGDLGISEDGMSDEIARIQDNFKNNYDEPRSGDLFFHCDEKGISIRIDNDKVGIFFNFIGIPQVGYTQEAIRDLYLRQEKNILDDKRSK